MRPLLSPQLPLGTRPLEGARWQRALERRVSPPPRRPPRSEQEAGRGSAEEVNSPGWRGRVRNSPTAWGNAELLLSHRDLGEKGHQHHHLKNGQRLQKQRLKPKAQLGCGSKAGCRDSGFTNLPPHTQHPVLRSQWPGLNPRCFPVLSETLCVCDLSSSHQSPITFLPFAPYLHLCVVSIASTKYPVICCLSACIICLYPCPSDVHPPMDSSVDLDPFLSVPSVHVLPAAGQSCVYSIYWFVLTQSLPPAPCPARSPGVSVPSAWLEDRGPYAHCSETSNLPCTHQLSCLLHWILHVTVYSSFTLVGLQSPFKKHTSWGLGRRLSG